MLKTNKTFVDTAKQILESTEQNAFIAGSDGIITWKSTVFNSICPDTKSTQEFFDWFESSEYRKQSYVSDTVKKEELGDYHLYIIKKSTNPDQKTESEALPYSDNAISESQTQQKSSQTNLLKATWEFDPDTSEFDFSENFRHVYNIPEDIELTADLISEITPKDIHDEFMGHINNIWKNGKKWDFQTSSKDYFGNPIILRSCGQLTKKDNKKKIIAFTQNVTEEANKQSNFEQLLFRSPIPIIMYSLKGKGITYANDMALSFFDCNDFGRLKNKNLMEVSPKNQATGQSLIMAKAMKANSQRDKVFKTKWVFKTLRGILKETEVSVSRIFAFGNETIVVSILDLSELRRTEEKVREVENDYLRAQEIGGIGTWVKYIKTEKENFSSTALRILGLHRQAKPSLIDFIHSLDLEQSNALIKGIKKLKQVGDSFSYQVNIKSKDNVAYLKSFDMQFFYDEKASGDTIIATILDITDKQNALLKAEENLRLNKAINETTPNIVYIFSLESFSNIYSNRHIGEIIGYTQDEIKAFGSQMLPKLLHPDDKEVVNEHFKRLIDAEDNQVLIVEYRMKHKNGDYAWLNSRDVIFKRDEAGNPIQTLGVAFDVTSRKENEIKIKDQHFKIESILQSAKTFICSLDTEQKIVFHNDLFQKYVSRLNQYDTDLRNNDYLTKVIKPDKASQFEEALRRCKDYGPQQFIHELKTGNSSEIYQVKINPIYLQSTDKDTDVLSGYSVFVINITELEKAKQDAENASRAKSVFLANMSHEIRTPMNAILGFAELMQSESSDPNIKNYAKTILGSGKALLNIINDILDISKIEAGKVVVKPELSCIADIIEESITLHKYRAESKSLYLKLDTDITCERLYNIDAGKISQILINLLSNAIKFTDSGGITVTAVSSPSNHTSAAEKSLMDFTISVTDTGIGIPKSQAKRLFQPFVQQEEQDDKKYGGTGLGLSIIKNLTNLMGGEVLLESEQNVGSTFSIVFKDVETVKQKAPIRANRNIKILSVDDSELNQKIIQGILKKTNHDLLFASSEDTALEVIQNNTPELFIMDIQLPGTDGIELTRIIKKDKRFIETPFIAATGYTFTGKEETVANELFDDIIYKPLNSRALLSLVEKHIDIKAKISIDSYSNSQTAEETGISFSENDNNDVIYVTDKEFSLFSADINRLALTMELNSIDNLSDRMIRYYNESKPSSEKDKLRVAKINSHLEQLKNSISEFDIEGITNTLNTIKDIFNGYNEN